MAQSPSNGKSSHYELQRATPKDADAIEACSQKAFGTSYLYERLFPKDKAHLTSPEEKLAWLVSDRRKTMSADDILCFKIISKAEPERVIGYANWYKPGHFRDKKLSDNFGGPTEQKSTENVPGVAMIAPAMPEAPPDTADQKAGLFPACMDGEATMYFLVTLDEERKKIWGGDVNYWYLVALAVDPDHQRQGIASRFMKEGLGRADADGLPTYLEATPDGALMYPKFGFKKIAEHSLFDGRHVVQSHVRSPSPRS